MKKRKDSSDEIRVPFLLAGGNPHWRPSESPTFTVTRPKLSQQYKETRGRPRRVREPEPEESHEE